MKSYDNYVDSFILYQNSIIGYKDNLLQSTYPRKVYERYDVSKEKNYTGEMSKFAAKKIKNVMTTWLTALDVFNSTSLSLKKEYRFRPVFLTLTLSGSTSKTHKEIQREGLQLFIKQLKYRFGVEHVFWKAELQKNNNLHYHLVIDRFVDKKEIQHRWNSIQSKHLNINALSSIYANNQAPSTHVKAINNFARSVDYVMKYVSKDNEAARIDGKVYDFSKILSSLKPFIFDSTVISTCEVRRILDRYTKLEFQGDWYSSYSFNKNDLISVFPQNVQDAYYSYYLDIFSNLHENVPKALILSSFIQKTQNHV